MHQQLNECLDDDLDPVVQNKVIQLLWRSKLNSDDPKFVVSIRKVLRDKLQKGCPEDPWTEDDEDLLDYIVIQYINYANEYLTNLK